MMQRLLILITAGLTLAACIGAQPAPAVAPVTPTAAQTGPMSGTMNMSGTMPLSGTMNMSGMNMDKEQPMPTVTPGIPANISPATPDLTGFPVTIQNCGRTLTFQKPPERVVPLYPLTAEFLLRLGLQDRITGVVFAAGDPLASDLTSIYQKLPVITTDSVPNREVLLTARPDFVLDNFPGFFYNGASGAATIEELQANGAQAYTLTARCDGNEANGKVADLYTDLLNLGKIFGVSDRAQQLVNELQGRVAAVQAKVAGKPKPRVLIYDSGVGPINVYGPGAITDVVAQAGGQNVFADQPREFMMLSAEEVANRDPEIFIVIERQAQPAMSMGKDLSAQEAADFLIKTFPNTTAAKNKRVVSIPYQYLYASLQNITGIEFLAKAFYPDAFAVTAPTANPFPVTIENCGRKLTFTKAPERVVTLWQPPNEMLLALGLQDRIVAMAGNYTDLLPELATAAAKIPIIGKSMDWPAKEMLLSQKPDLVVSEGLVGFAFDATQGRATVEELNAAGAQAISTGSSCDPMAPSAKSLATVYADLEMLGQIFGVTDRADALIAKLKAHEEAITAKVAGSAPVKVAFYNGGEGPLNVLTSGVWEDEMTRAGGKDVLPANVYQVSAEEFAAAQPDVILVGYFPGQDPDQLVAYLKKTFPNIPAVQNSRLAPIPVIETEASVRIMDGFEKIARALHPEAFQ